MNSSKGLSISSRLNIALVVFYSALRFLDGFAVELTAFLWGLAVYLILPSQAKYDAAEK